MALNFPNSPSTNDIHTYNGKSWQWNGTLWLAINAGIQGAQGLQGVQGVQGVQGLQGVQGTQGTTGAQGTSGASILGTNNTWSGTNAFTTLSATGALSTTIGGDTITLGASGVGYLQTFSRADANYIRASSAGGYFVFQTGGANNRAVINDTGLAVTGALSATDNSSVTKSTNGVTSFSVSNVSTGTSAFAAYYLTNSDGTNQANIGLLGGSYTSVVGWDVQSALAISNVTAGGISIAARSGSSSIRNYIGDGTAAITTVTSTGLGIGTSSPTAKLHVVAPSVTTPSLTWNTTAGQILRNENLELAIGRDANAPYRLWMQVRGSDNTANDLVINPLGGNVGIGTTSPSSKLHVSGGIFATTSIQADAAVMNASGGFASFGSNSGSVPIRIGRDTTSNDLIINASGNVGIGTTSPTTKLHVDQGADSNGITLAYSGRGASRINWDLSGVTNEATTFFHNNGTNRYVMQQWSRDYVSFYSNNTERARIDSAGSVIASVDVRAPIFYDSNDTAYYVNPNASSYIYDLYIDRKLKHSGYSGTRYFTFDVGNVSNTKAKLHFSGWFWGNIEISAASSYNYANRPGIVKKRYAFGGSPAGDQYTNESRIVESMGQTPNGITFGEIFWDSSVSKWAIIVASLDSSANTYQLEVKCFCPDSTSRDAIIDSMTMTATYTSDTTAYTYANSSYKKLIIGGTVATPSTFSIKQTADNGAGAFQIENYGSTNSWYLQIGSDQNLYVKYNDGARGVFNNSTGAYTTVSDSRVKKDISDISFGLDVISRLKPVEYRMIDSAENSVKNLGFIAQEVSEVIPSSVTQMNGGMYGLDKSEIIPVIVKALQELKADNDSLRARLAALESK
jgi:hypothetical protein